MEGWVLGLQLSSPPVRLCRRTRVFFLSSGGLLAAVCFPDVICSRPPEFRRLTTGYMLGDILLRGLTI